MMDFVNSVRPGGRIELYKLAKDHEVTEALKTATQDLVTRKILESYNDGTISVKAYVLDLWLHRWIAKLGGTHQFGAPAIFTDIANLTQGKGTPYVADLKTTAGEGFAGRFTLATVLDRIERYVRTLTPAMVAVRWAVNYPPGSPAVTEVSKKEYLIKNIPEDFRKKGSDDHVLIEKITEVEQAYPTANHFVFVLGDKDYRLALERLIKAGKFVHIVSREEGMADNYRAYAVRYPEQVTAISLEKLLENG
jgi:NYN domain